VDQASDRPDICIGTDEFHTPAPLADEFVRRFSAEALAVVRNRPFGGTIVPMRYFRNDRRVMSIMIEVNRRLYLDEATGKVRDRFVTAQSLPVRVLAAVRELRTELTESANRSPINPNIGEAGDQNDRSAPATPPQAKPGQLRLQLVAALEAARATRRDIAKVQKH